MVNSDPGKNKRGTKIMGLNGPPWVPSNFLALPEAQSNLDQARVVVLPVPYDSTTSFRGGAREGPRAVIEASYNLEDYDPELDADVAQVGIYTAPYLEPHMDGPRAMIDRVGDAVRTFLDMDKVVATVGGEHSISVGAVEALARGYLDPWGSQGLSVLYLDAHGDLREDYMGTRWGHASVARRISEICPLVQVGVRSLSTEEKEFIDTNCINTFFWPDFAPIKADLRTHPRSNRGQKPLQKPLNDVVDLLSKDVYISIDLDVLDPSIMSAVGTPEPGGMDWYQVTSLLRAVAEKRHIVGFDVMELCPNEGPSSCSYTAAKLIYKLIAYTTLFPERQSNRSETHTKLQPDGQSDRSKQTKS